MPRLGENVTQAITLLRASTLEVQNADRRAELLYQAACDAWEAQGRRKCHVFYLAILHYCLIPLFNTRAGVVQSELAERDVILGNTSRKVDAPGLLTQQMKKLKAKWSTKMTIASRDNEYVIIHREEDLKRNSISVKRARKSTRRTLTKLEKRKRKVIFEAIEFGLTGEDYCEELDKSNVSVPATWIAEGCPRSYSIANLEGRWEKRIQDEKHRFNLKYRALRLKNGTLSLREQGSLAVLVGDE